MFGIYIVSIEESKSQRLSSFFKQNFFKDIPENDINIVGIKGGNMTAKEYFNLAVHGRTKPLTPGELGCTLSHLEIYKRFLLTENNFALIFEDDAIFPEALSYKELWDQIKQYKFGSGFLLSLGGIQMKVCRKVRGMIQENKLYSKQVIKVNPHFYNKICYTYAYVIDRTMAEILLKYHDRPRRADDWSYLYDFNSSINIYMTNLIDHPVEQTNQNSYLENERKKTLDIPQTKLGKGISKELAKLQYQKFNLN